MGSRVEIILVDEKELQRPFCKHGPTILFRKVGHGQKPIDFYACSLYRDGKKCKIHILKKEWNDFKDRDMKNRDILCQIAKEKPLAKESSGRNFCQSCGVFFKEKSMDRHLKHRIMKDLGKDRVREIKEYPSKFLELKENDKGEAQYIFSGKTLLFFKKLLEQLNFTKILCIGTPTIHSLIARKIPTCQSFLLDIDERYANFFKEEFAKFNMFNCYFFECQEAEGQLRDFLKLKNDSRLAIFIDPPFGCRTELLGECLRKLQELFREVNWGFTQILTVFLILPYFMETYVKNELPQLEMLDYRVNYVNHTNFHDDEDGGRFGSPVRIFTNALPSLVELPADEGYRKCKICSRWVSENNSHCPICQKCPSKNGGPYKHCEKCGICVKSFYRHCNSCNRCTQESNHVCQDYQKNASCWICRQKGHIEKYCNLRKRKAKSTAVRTCGICSKKNHSELHCTRRKAILGEESFMGRYSINYSSQ
ncbi:rRNA N6-adenosine-methyltransferase ZCCHC4 [Phlebotomus papatasi]|uniref:rRNA N6-adenosine-methyltransferase ZCCHC4 n=1 Tax=Phlebotomus papatasi TaxID=29031 RepID=UPI002484689E|nr:rRNA N6-adenosine-methyltransferase ZCCHC4 [Phlebotomus papatasi]